MRPYLLFIIMIAVGVALLVTACAHAPEHVVYRPVVVQTPVSCVPDTLGPEPAWLETPESLAAVPDGPDRYVRLGSDWLARVARLNELETVLRGCRR